MGLVLLVSLVACGGEKNPPPGGPEVDAGVDAGDADGGELVTVVPLPPALPAMTPCPAGWREVVDADSPDVVFCDPFGEAGPLDCTVDEADFAGGGGCERIGTTCPAGDFADDLPGADVVYVLAGAAEGGDGTLALPFATIGEAVAAVPDEGVVALSKGTFDEVVVVDRPLTLWGACVAQTVIASSSPNDFEAAITFTGTAGGGARNLQITGARRGIAALDNTAPVEIDSIAIHDAVGAGITAEPGLVHVANVVVRDMIPQVSDGHRGNGLRLALGGNGTFERVAVERCWANGVRVSEPETRFVATNLVVRDTAPESVSDLSGYGFQINAGGNVELHEAAVVRSHENAIVVGEPASTLVATDLFVSDTRSRAKDQLIGFGLHVVSGGHVDLTRATFRGNRTVAVEAHDPGTEVSATDLVLLDTIEEEADARGGMGGSFWGAAKVDLVRVAALRNGMAGVIFGDEGTDFTVEDLVVRDTRTDASDGTFGVGTGATNGAAGSLHRVLLERNRSAAMVAELGASITATDVDVRATDVRDDGRFGTGILAIEGSVDVTSFRVVDNVLCGVQVVDGTLDLHDGEVAGNRIGANVQTPGFEIARLQDGVLFLRNVVDLDTSLLPVPDPIPEIR